MTRDDIVRAPERREKRESVETADAGATHRPDESVALSDCRPRDVGVGSPTAFLSVTQSTEFVPV